MRVFLFSFIVVMLCTIFPASVQAQVPDMAKLHATAHRIKMGTLFEWSECGATAIAPHALLTASHCEEASDTVQVDGTAAQILLTLRDGNDHSILLLIGPDFKHIAHVVETLPQQGDTIFYWGNPNNHPDILRRGYFAGMMELPWADSGKRKSIMLDVNVGEGDSGSGIFNEQGNVFTVMSFNRDDVTFSKQMAGALPMTFTAHQLSMAKAF